MLLVVAFPTSSFTPLPVVYFRFDFQLVANTESFYHHSVEKGIRIFFGIDPLKR